MKTKNYLRLCAVVVAAGVVFATTEVKAVPTTCEANGHTAKFKDRLLFPDAPEGTIIWQYEIQDNPNDSKISEVVMVVPLPVTPADIKSPPPKDFCEEADPYSKINRGNCAGFPVRLPLVRNGHTILLEIKTADTIAPGVVTLNIVSHKGDSDVCIGFENDQPTGITGPGGGPSPDQPVFLEQRVLAAGGNCVARLIFDSRGRLRDLESETPGCFKGSAQLFISRDESSQNPEPLRNIQTNPGPIAITFGSNTATCYGPDIPSPSLCVCTVPECP
jgi:hypothetical protein